MPHRLALTWYSPARAGGVADVVRGNRRGVWGGLYEVGPRGLAKLDRREGHPCVYRREVVAVWRNGKPDESVTAWFYRVVNRARDTVPAASAYKSIIVAGARERKLPRAYVRGILNPLPVEDRAACDSSGGLWPGWARLPAVACP